jgi:L,D-transpeptidase ErfK/SrfK
MVGDVVEYVVVPGETFETIGARFGVDPRAIARRNTRWVYAPLVPGMKLVVAVHRTVPAGLERGILVNVPQRLLFVLDDDGAVVAVPIAIGRPDWPTPTGAFRVTSKETKPTWDVPPSIQEEMKRQGRLPLTKVPPGPQNPLGEFWIGLSLRNMGIHCTNVLSSIPGLTPHVCIRVAPDRIKAVFDFVTIGTAGEILYEPALLTNHDGRFFVEVHPDVYGRGSDALSAIEAAADYLGARDRIDWHRVQGVVRLHEGLAIDVTLK